MSSSSKHDYEADLRKTKFYDSEQYKCLERIGAGSYGVCYLIATKEKDVKFYALKISEMKDSLDTEIENFDKVNVPLCVKSIEHYSDDEDVYWNLMEYVPGISLGDFINGLEDGKFKTFDFMKIATLLCSQIEALHMVGVAHRDIKPDNIIIDADFTPHIIDYGECKGDLVLDENGTTGKIHGTFPFMSKEAMQLKTCLLSDVFSLGATLFNMITGHYPFFKLYYYIFEGDKKALRFYKEKIQNEELFIKMEELREEFNENIDNYNEIDDDLENSEENREDLLKQKKEIDEKLKEIQEDYSNCVDKIVGEIICSNQYDDIYQNYSDLADTLSDKQKELMGIVYSCFNPESTQRPEAIVVRDMIFELAPKDIQSELDQVFEDYGFDDESINNGAFPKFQGNNLECAERAIQMHLDYNNRALEAIGNEYIPDYEPTDSFEFSNAMVTYSASSYKW